MADYQNLKSLAELGIKSTPAVRSDGQKNFAAREVSLNQITGTVICIVDYETGISTRFTRQHLQEAQANGDMAAVEKKKYLVCARVVTPNKAQLEACNVTLKRGDLIKFFTGYPDMCAVCDKLKELNMLDANKVTVTRNAQARFTEYLFT